MKNKAKIIKRTAIVLALLILIGIASVIGINAYIKSYAEPYIVSDIESLEGYDCILVLGCGLTQSGEPGKLLKSRLDAGLDAYRKGAAPKLLMSGDHGRKGYDEVNAMKAYAIEKGMASEDVFMDHAGFSTYESMYRARDVFAAKKIVIVTQRYHLYRAIYNAKALGLDVVGVEAEDLARGRASREVRELAARCKDFVWAMFKPKPTYLGEVIPVSGNGDLTND